MDDFLDDFDHDFEGMEDDSGNDWDDEPDFEDKPAESDDDFWDGPGERCWPLIFPIAEEISKEKREHERARKKAGRDDDDYCEWLNRNN